MIISVQNSSVADANNCHLSPKSLLEDRIGMAGAGRGDEIKRTRVYAELDEAPNKLKDLQISASPVKPGCGQQHLAAENARRFMDLYRKLIIPQPSLALESSLTS